VLWVRTISLFARFSSSLLRLGRGAKLGVPLGVPLLLMLGF
jgi:hypothetical protein